MDIDTALTVQTNTKIKTIIITVATHMTRSPDYAPTGVAANPYSGVPGAAVNPCTAIM